MKVLQLANSYLTTDLYRRLFAAQKPLGIENTVFLPALKGASTEYAPDPRVIIAPCFSQVDRLLFITKQKKMIAAIEKSVDCANLDLVHAHTLFSAGYAAMKLREKYGTPYVVAVRNTDVNVFLKYMVHLRKTGMEVLRQAEQIVFLSPAYLEFVFAKYVPAHLREELRKKSVVIPNGINDLFLENRHSRKPLEGEHVRLIYVGEISRNKNLELTVKAAKRLRSEGLDVSITAIGALLDDSYKSLIRETEFLTYHERCSQEEVIRYLNQADIFVMPSHGETFGLVYAEAMSQGLPVLYTRGQGFDGHFPDGTVGYAVSDQNPVELAEKIKLVIKNYGQLSANCEQCVDRFNWHSIARVYLRMYQNMLPPVSGAEGETKQ